MIEGESGKPSLEDLLKEFRIPPLPQGVSRSEVYFPNGSPPLSLLSALSCSPEEMLSQSLNRLRINEGVRVAEKRHGGGKRPQREITDIREKFRKERKRLLTKGPGRVLATLVANSGKVAQWTPAGLERTNGENQGWIVPDENEIEWWGWVYEQARKSEGIGELIEGDKAELLHAFFVARVRRLPPPQKDQFIRKIDQFVPEDEKVIGRLKQISQRLK